MEKKMDMQRNILKEEIWHLKVNIKMGKNGMEKDMIIKIISFMNSMMEKEYLKYMIIIEI